MRCINVVVLAVLAAACQKPATVEPTSNRSVVTIELANEEMARGHELDYESPMRTRTAVMHRLHAFELYRTACLEGDRRACLRATLSQSSPQWKDLSAWFDEACGRGDELACRWRTWDTLYGKPFPRELSTAELRRGCEAWIVEECGLLRERATTVEEQRRAAEASCLVNTYQCEEAADSYLRDEPRDPARARYLLELSCQVPPTDACLTLSAAYRSGRLKEPVPGRGVELHRYICDAYARASDCSGGVDLKCVEDYQAFVAKNACE